MPFSLPTIKRLFVKSGNQCAFPGCQAKIVIGDAVIGEVCHIRARRKNGPRYDPNLTAKERDECRNLLLLCPTHYTLIDKDVVKFTPELLLDIKEMHERSADIEISPEITRSAELILTKVTSKSKDKRKSSANARDGSVAVSIAGDNSGNIDIRVTEKTKAKGGPTYPQNSIGADANLTGYIDYLCDLYVKYMSPVDKDVARLHGKLGQHIKNHFRLRKQTRNHLPAEKFDALVDYLIDVKLAKTPVGRKHISRGTALCSSFEEWRLIK